MLPLLRPTALRRLLPPQRGAIANARDGVRALAADARTRPERGLAQARALGTESWSELGRRGFGPYGHGVHVSTDDADLLSRLTAFVVEGLADGELCLVALTPSHRRGLLRHLDLVGMTDAARQHLVVADAATVVARVLREGRPDPDLFERCAAEPVRELQRSGQPVRAAGEMAGVLIAAGDLAGALELEQLWDDLQRELGIPLLCCYAPTPDVRFLEQVHATHSHLVSTVG